MKRNVSPHVMTKSILGSLFVLTLLLSSSVSYGQTPANFSGVWIQDTSKSDDFYKKFDVKFTITQTLQTFTVKQTFAIKGSKEDVIRDYTYTLDGKVTNYKKEYGTEKNLAQWSADKKILNTRSTVTYGNQDVGFTEAYSLSDKGLVLTILKTDIIPESKSLKMIFKKKM